MIEPAATAIAFNLRLLGSPGIVDADGQPLAGLGHGKPLAMLAYLAVRQEARREELIELLWGGVPESRARNAFRQSLHRLRSALGDELVPLGRERVTVLADTAFRVDRTVFVASCDAGRWEDAVEAYGGDFLEGLDVGEPAFDQWADNERMRLRSRYEVALREATQQALDAGRLLKAVGYAQSLSTVLPYDDAAANLEATVLIGGGRQAEALASLRRFAGRMRTEMELPVSPAIRELTTRLERTARQPSPAYTNTVGRAGNLAPSFQGRDDELARLVGYGRELSRQRGATVLVDGEAGIGKTRLIDEFVGRMLSLEDMLFVRGRERVVGTTLPYASIAEALRSLIAAPGVAGTSRHLLTEAARILPELRDQFDLEPPAPVEDEGGRLRFFEGVAALIDSAAYEQPVCIILDDLHHASPATLDLIGYLSGRLQASPVLIVLIARIESAPTASAARLRDIASGSAGLDSVTSEITVGPLSDEAIQTLVGEYAHRRSPDTMVDAARIAALANGRVMPALEWARRALDGDMPSNMPLPLRDILWARLQTASPSARRVFFAASLLQRDASLRLLAAAAHLPESASFDAALSLERMGLLAPSGDGFAAAHDATLSFVLEASGVAGRALLAGWAADALAAEHDASDAELAHLYALAGQTSAAFRHARAAAFSAAAIGAAAEAARLASIALTFAADDRSRRDIETLLTALGARDFRLLNRAEPAELHGDAREVDDVDEVQDVALIEVVEAEDPGQVVDANAAPAQTTIPPQTRTGPSPPRPRRSRVWGIAAIGTLLVSAAVLQRQYAARPVVRSLPDSVVVVERGATAGGGIHLVTGPLTLNGLQFLAATSSRPGWLDSVKPPFVNPTLSPDGRLMSVERMTPAGTDLFAISADRRDSTRLTTGGGDDIALGWAPDGKSLLVSRARTLSDGSYDADLFVYHIKPLAAIPLDTSPDRAVREAQWSPDGTSIAWVATVGARHQQEVFVSRADGSHRRNVSANPADDNQISWSPDGSLVAFSSNRTGTTHIYTYDLENDRLWTVTSGQFADSHPMFSPDGRFLAFESTRDGDAAVYVTLPLGGTTVRVTPAGRQFSISGWRGRTPRYVDRLRIVGPSSAGVGDTVKVGVLAIDQTGAPLPFSNLSWSSSDSSIVRLADSASMSTVRLAAHGAGAASVVAQIPGWRRDSLALEVGQSSPSLFADDFSRGVLGPAWWPRGSPLPRVAAAPGEGSGRAMYPNADREWSSGILSEATIDLGRPVAVSARMYAPFGGRPIPAASMELSLIPADARSQLDATAPQFTALASVVWNGESDRVTYAVGREAFSEGTSGLPLNRGSHLVSIAVDSEGNVTFSLDGIARWKSALRFVGEGVDRRVRLWLGGQATSTWGAFSEVRIEQVGRRSH
jgi:Tol biopolymer transport system component/DNA-binding SARP family transcriptional activator